MPTTTPPVEEPTEGEKIDNLVETVSPEAAHRPQRIAGPKDTPFEGFDRTYVQKPLSFFGKTEFVRLISHAIDNAMKGEDGLSITKLMGVTSMQELTSADIFVRALVRLAENTPDLLKDVYMISLNVPRHERDIVSQIFDMPAEEDGTGGLSDEDGIAIMNTFVEQNAKALMGFFRDEMPKVVERTQKLLGAQTQASSKPSKRSARNTP